MLANPEMFDRQLQEWRSPQAKAAYDAAQDRYSRQKLQSDELQRTLDAIQRQMFPDVNWPTEPPPQTPPPGTTTPLPGHGTPERGRTGAMTLPDPTPGETAVSYIDRMEAAGYDLRNAQVEANIRAKIRQWQLPLGRGSTRSPRDTLDALGNYSSPYTQY